MSIEEAREGIHKWCDLWDVGYADPGYDVMQRETDEALERLILEVKASMPCYGMEIVRMAMKAVGVKPATVMRDCRAANSTPFCPSCEAREQLTGILTSS